MSSERTSFKIRSRKKLGETCYRSSLDIVYLPEEGNPVKFAEGLDERNHPRVMVSLSEDEIDDTIEALQELRSEINGGDSSDEQ